MTEAPHRQRMLDFLQHPVFRRRRSRAGALHRRRRIPRQRPDRYPAAYGPSPRQGRNARDVEGRAAPAIPSCAARCRSWSIEGDKVGRHIRVFFRKNINQRMVQFDVAGFYTLRDGKISHIREIIDTFDLVQQLLERDVAAILTGREVQRNLASAPSSSFRRSAARAGVDRAQLHIRSARKRAASIFRAPLNLDRASAVTHHKAVSGHEEHMKIALLALLGLALGALGGAALGIGAGLAWVEIFKTTSFEGYSGHAGVLHLHAARAPRSAVSAAPCCSARSRFATPKSPSNASLRAVMTVK